MCHVVFRKKKIYNNDFNCNKGAILTKCVEKNTLSQNMLHLGQNGLYVLCLLTIRTTVHQRVFFLFFFNNEHNRAGVLKALSIFFF